MFNDYCSISQLENLPESRHLALLRSSLGTEGYRICAELCPTDSSYDETIRRLQERFSPKPSVIYARAQFNRRTQNQHENIIQFVTELRALARKCTYNDRFVDELIRDRFIAGIINDRLREHLFLQKDDISLEDSIKLAQNFERASSESIKINKSLSSSNNIQKVTFARHSQHASFTRAFSRARNRFMSPRTIRDTLQSPPPNAKL